MHHHNAEACHLPAETSVGTNPIATCRVKASGAPHKALALDNIITSVVEPGLSAEDKALREERRTAWAAKADATHKSWDTLLNRAAAAGKPSLCDT